MTRVTGIGGVFFKARDPEKLREWYREHLGIALEEWGGAIFRWQTPERPEIGSNPRSPAAIASRYDGIGCGILKL